MNQPKVTITQVTKQSGNYRYYVEVTIEGKLYLTRPAVTAEHSAVLASGFHRQYPQAELAWRGES